MMIEKILYWKWKLNCYIGRSQLFDQMTDGSIMAILTSYNTERLKNIDPIIRSILKCEFIEKVVVSNHNPDIKLEQWVRVKDERLKLINQNTRYGPGYRWEIAYGEDSDFIILIDDDLFIYPGQIKILIQHLFRQPGIPHGITGHYNTNYYQNLEMEVDTLNQIYAITRQHLEKYFELLNAIKVIDHTAYESIELYADDVLISRSGINKPMIHNIGSLLRCNTARKPGVAMHLEENFIEKRNRVVNVLDKILQR